MNTLLAHIKSLNVKTQEWIDEDPEHRFAGMVPESIEFWAQYDIYTVTDYERHELTSSYYDLYKDVHGISPRWVNFNQMSTADIKVMYDSLVQESQEVFEEEKAEQEASVARFESKLKDLVSFGAKTRENAINWLKQAEGDDYYDDGMFEYDNNLPYGYLGQS